MKNKILTLSIAGFLLIILLSSGTTDDKTEANKKIEVTGSAEMEIVPDEIYTTFTLKEYLSTSKKKVRLDSVKSEFLRICKKAGIADSNISISSYTGTENWDYYYWYKKRHSEPDFMASISYTVKVSSTEKLDKIVAGLNEDAVSNFYISKTSHSKIEQFRKEVKTKALVAGKAKAEYLVKSIGEELDGALSIQEVDDSYNNYYYGYNSNLNVSNSISQTSLNSGESNSSSTTSFQKIKLRYEMKVVFKLK